MRFQSTSALWWLLLGAVIVLLYLLKLKRRRTVVPSVILWRRALEEFEANAPFRRLRRSLLMLLQLLALAAMVAALAGPLVTTRALATGATIIVIDSTASMSARDEGAGSRLDRAKRLAREMVDGLGGGDRAALVESSSRVTIRSSLTFDRVALAAAIDEIQPTDAPGDLTEAVRLARQIARGQPETSIVIVSDGCSTIDLNVDPARLESAGDQSPVRFVRVGVRSENAGIVAMNSRWRAGSAGRELFASVANFGEAARTVPVELRIDDKLIDARSVDISAGGRSILVFDELPAEGGFAELKLDLDDDLASDNIAYSFLPISTRARVGVISENPFLLQALASVPDIDANRITSGSTAARFDSLIIEGSNREAALAESRAVLAINPPDLPGLCRKTGARGNIESISADRAHPVNAFLSFADLHIETASRYEVAPWLKPIVNAGPDPLIWAGDDGRRRAVLIGFDLAKSDLPLKVEFPILIANSLAWLAGRGSLSAERVVRPGQPAIVDVPATDAVITKPTGENQIAVEQNGTVVFGDTLRVGKYLARGAPAFAVSLSSEAESNTGPRDSIQTRGGKVEAQADTFSSEREIWRWLALLCLAVLSFEWWAYHRRIFG